MELDLKVLVTQKIAWKIDRLKDTPVPASPERVIKLASFLSPSEVIGVNSLMWLP